MNQKRPVSEHALIKRINRRLAPDECVKKSRTARARFDLGEHYIHDYANNTISCTNIDLESFGRSTGALADDETWA